MPRVKARQFLDEHGNRWTVLRAGSLFQLVRKPATGIRLHEVARSCARVLGVTLAPNGTPLEHVNEHIRIWGAIWNKGQEVEIDVDENKIEEQS